MKQPKEKVVISVKRLPFKKLAVLASCALGCSALLFVSLKYAGPLKDRMKEIFSFSVTEIEVDGNRILSKQKIVESAMIPQGKSSVGLSVDAIKNNLLQEPYIRDAKVTKIFPSRLKIEIVERKPIAIIEDGGLFYLDEDGTAFKRVDPGSGDQVDLPTLTGIPSERSDSRAYRKTVVEQSFAILNKIAQEQITKQEDISEVNFCEIYGFSIYMGRKPLRIVLGFADLEKKISRLKTVLMRLTKNAQAVALIDMDYENKAVVRLKRAI
jgi:cell division septal protein FtsQ